MNIFISRPAGFDAALLDRLVSLLSRYDDSARRRPAVPNFSRPVRVTALTLSLALLFARPMSAKAEDTATAQPVFKPAPGAVISGLSGLVAGTRDALTADRATERINIVRRELTSRMLAAPDARGKLTLGGAASGSNGSTYALSNAMILCDPRGNHAVAAADAGYIDAITSSLTGFAKPPKIPTIGDAVGTLFQHYSIEAPKGKSKKDTAQAVIERCSNDAVIWPSFSYGRTLDAQPKESAPAELAIEDISAVGSAVSTLYSAIVAILTPIVVGTAKAADAQARAEVISAFVLNYRTTLIDAGQSLADKGSRFARKKRLDAFSQFAEKMAVLRSVEIDLSKTKGYGTAIGNPVLPLPKDAPGSLVREPTDEFVRCYAAAWMQLSDAVQDVLVAASQYDAFADASDDQFKLAVVQIKNNIAQMENPTQPQLKELWEAAAQFVAFGQTVSQALSKDNIDKAKKAIDDLMKLFGSKG